MERFYRPDQEILDELEVGMSVAEVLNLSTSEYSARLRRLNLSPRAATLVKCLRRRIKNRVASQNSRRRSADHIRSLTEQLSAVRASKCAVLSRRRRLRRQLQLWAARLGRLSSYVSETLQHRGDETPLPEGLRVPHPSPHPQYSPPQYSPHHPQYSPHHPQYSPHHDKFTCDLHSLMARSIHHIYRYEYDKDDADAVLDFRKRSDRRAKGRSCTDPSVEDNIKNEREEVAKALQLLAMTEPKTEPGTDVFQNGYASESLYLDSAKESNAKESEHTYTDDAVLRSEFYSEHSLYSDEWDSKSGREKRDERVRVRAKCVQIECEGERTVREEDLLRGCKRARRQRVQTSCIMHTSDVRAVEEEIEYFQRQSFVDAESFFCGEGEKCDNLRSEVLNLSLKNKASEKKHHGRKQVAPRRIKHADVEEDMVLDLKIKKSCK